MITVLGNSDSSSIDTDTIASARTRNERSASRSSSPNRQRRSKRKEDDGSNSYAVADAPRGKACHRDRGRLRRPLLYPLAILPLMARRRIWHPRHSYFHSQGQEPSYAERIEYQERQKYRRSKSDPTEVIPTRIKKPPKYLGW